MSESLEQIAERLARVDWEPTEEARLECYENILAALREVEARAKRETR